MGKRLMNWAIIVLSAVGLAAYLLISEGPQRIAEVFSSIDVVWITVAITSITIAWIADAVSLRLLIGAYGTVVPLWKVFKASRIGMMFALITPLQMGLMPAQMVLLSKEGVRSGDSATALVVKNILFGIAVCLILGGLLVYDGSSLLLQRRWLFYVVIGCFALNALFILLLFIVGKAKESILKAASFIIDVLGKLRLVKRVEYRKGVAAFEIQRLNDNFKKLDFTSWRTIGALVAIVAQLVLLHQSTYFIYRALGKVEAGYLTVLAKQLYVYAIQSVMPIPGGLGASDSGFILMLEPLFGKGVVSFGLILWRLLTFYLPILLGLFLTFGAKRRTLGLE
jgi:uncharacterized protein (TIRG00374 family)